MVLRVVSAIIPAGQSMSEGVDCSGSLRIVRLITPSKWTKAPVTFQMSPDGADYHDLHHVAATSLAGYEVTIPVIRPDSVVAFPPGTGTSVNWIKVRSGTQAMPIKQGADSTFQFVLEDADEAAGGGGSDPALEARVAVLEDQMATIQALYQPVMTNAQLAFPVAQASMGDALCQMVCTNSPTSWVITSETKNDVPTSGYWEMDASGNLYAAGAAAPGAVAAGDRTTVNIRASNDFGSSDGFCIIDWMV